MALQFGAWWHDAGSGTRHAARAEARSDEPERIVLAHEPPFRRRLLDEDQLPVAGHRLTPAKSAFCQRFISGTPDRHPVCSE
jgi:hypothetical protein